MAGAKLPIEVSVKGVAAFAWLYKKDEKFAKKPEDAKFKLTLIVDKDEIDDLPARLDNGETVVSGKEWLTHIQEMHDQAGGDEEPQNCPVKDGDKQLDKKGKQKKETNKELEGKYAINFSTKWPVQMVDTKKNDLPEAVKIMSGDIVKVSYRPFQYEGGVTLRMATVMLIEKRAGGGGTAAFGDDEEGYVVEQTESAAAITGDDTNGDY